jgi:hypothetical protein
MYSESTRDFDVLYWHIIATMTSNKTFAWDKQPWESPLDWIGQTEPSVRLARLYTDLKAWAYVWYDSKVDIKTLNLSAGKITYLEKQKLGINKVAETLSVLAKWRYNKLSTAQTMLLISGIWSSNGTAQRRNNVHA